jgi:hypothetical protein
MATFRARNETLRGRPAVSLLEQPTRVFNSRGWSAMGNLPIMRLERSRQGGGRMRVG